MTKVIHNPTLASVDVHSDTMATFEVSPLHGGYGNTLGNSLRRVLLSSIEGTAVVAFKIDGVTHEFTTVPGVKEDVIDIMLNVKNIRLKSHSDEPVELHLEKTGAGVVTAGDIAKNAEVDVINPDLVIANIDDPKKKLVMDFVVDTGRGYKSIEESTKDRKYSDMIAVDAIFSPVIRVRYKVDGTRVGQDTSLEKLLLTVETDGSISPQGAFEEASAILVNQYSALAGETTVLAGPSLGVESVESESELETLIENLNLSARTTNALINNDIRIVRDLVTLSEQDLRELKGFGTKALEEVKDKLVELEL